MYVLLGLRCYFGLIIIIINYRFRSFRSSALLSPAIDRFIPRSSVSK